MAVTRRAPNPVRSALARRGSWRAEAVGAAAVYGIYELSRGLLVGGAQTAIRHATDIATLERSIYLFIERDLQRGAHSIPGLLGLFGGLYLTLHLAATGGYLLWLYRHRPTTYATVRTTLLVATLLSLVIFALYPTAPPRIAGVGISDTVSGAHFNLNHGLVGSLYNPFAAMPSMHFGYALIVGASLARETGPRMARLAGLSYPALVLLIILTTGNHFLFDAIAGALVVSVAALTARALTPAVATPDPRSGWSCTRSLPKEVSTACCPAVHAGSLILDEHHDPRSRSGRCASPSRVPRRHRALSKG